MFGIKQFIGVVLKKIYKMKQMANTITFTFAEVNLKNEKENNRKFAKNKLKEN